MHLPPFPSICSPAKPQTPSWARRLLALWWYCGQLLLCVFSAGVWFQRHGTMGWQRLAGVFLCVTGCEAMFADLGHFTRNAVRVSVHQQGRFRMNGSSWGQHSICRGTSGAVHCLHKQHAAGQAERLATSLPSTAVLIILTVVIVLCKAGWLTAGSC